MRLLRYTRISPAKLEFLLDPQRQIRTASIWPDCARTTQVDSLSKKADKPVESARN
jgi:hypothetical protein